MIWAALFMVLLAVFVHGDAPRSEALRRAIDAGVEEPSARARALAAADAAARAEARAHEARAELQRELDALLARRTTTREDLVAFLERLERAEREVEAEALAAPATLRTALPRHGWERLVEPQRPRQRVGGDQAQRKPTCDVPVSGAEPWRAAGR